MPSSLRALSWSRVGCVSIGDLSSMEVGWAADVFVRNRRPVRGRGRPFAIEVVLQDRVDRTVGACADLKRATASGIQSFATVALGEPQDADASPEALLRVRALSQNDLDER